MTTTDLHNLGRRVALSIYISTLAGCSTAPLIGSGYGEPPPQVAFLGAVDSKGQDYLTWDRPWSFGPVPIELQAVGDTNCMRVELRLRATGYHPKALDRSGSPIAGGGYFCQLALLFDDPAPPRVILRNGVPGWDRPSAFSAIPAEKLSAGLEACSKQNPKFKPLGFHSRPVDINGAVMEQGGFLCVE